MSYTINTNECTVCGSCEFECPNGAPQMKGDVYVINPKRCTECEGLEVPKCVAACPADAIVKN